jgi:hypothetical protein
MKTFNILVAKKQNACNSVTITKSNIITKTVEAHYKIIDVSGHMKNADTYKS